MPPRSTAAHQRSPAVGVDTGGTFTDLVLVAGEGVVATGKLHSTPDDPARGLLKGIRELVPHDSSLDLSSCDLTHGTTVALNALLTGQVAPTALVTNAGFRDLLEIGRQERDDLYELHPRKPAPLVSRDLRFEVDQRSWPDGEGGLEEVRVPTRAGLQRLRNAVRRSGAKSVAVCLLHSYKDPSIEQRVAEALASLGLPITCSAAILPAHREVERFSTAVANAALAPVMTAYLERLAREIPPERLSILQSSGGTLNAQRAAEEPVRVLFSGPAGGVVGAAQAADEAGLGELVTLDMGGTSTDVAFHSPGEGLQNSIGSARVAGHPIAVPALDIHTIGCGGGSLVHVDAGGVLHVGPDSAGADPGPVCYGSGEQLTVTDACVLLGHIAAQGFLDGEVPLDKDAVTRSFEVLGRQLGVAPLKAAQGVLDVSRATMRRALGVMTMQRGKDPARLPLVAFGGGGGLHAAALVESLDMPGALVPAHPGVLSALGMATADALRDHERTILAPLASWSLAARKRVIRELRQQGKRELRAAGFAAASIEYEHSLDLRYGGQSFELTLPEGRDAAERFARAHRGRYGWALANGEVELVALRVRALTRLPRAGARRRGRPRRRPAPARAVLGERRAWFGRWRKTARVDRAALSPGHVVAGPAIIEEYTATTIVPPGASAVVVPGGHLWLTAP